MTLRGREHYAVRHRYPVQDRKPRGFYGRRPVEIYDAPPCSITATAPNAWSSLRCWVTRLNTSNNDKDGTRSDRVDSIGFRFPRDVAVKSLE